MNSTEPAAETFIAGEAVQVIEQDCPLRKIGADHFRGKIGLVEGRNESYEEVHANVRAGLPRHRVYAVRLQASNVVAFVCEHMLRRVERGASITPALRVITEHNR